MQTQAHVVGTRVRSRRVEAARAESAGPRGSTAVTVFYLAAALACLAVVVAAAVGAAL